MGTTQLSRRLIIAGMIGGAVAPGLAPARQPVRVASPEATPCVALEDEEGCLPVAPESSRVDLGNPVFSIPTRITNPLFPVLPGTQAIQLGEEEGESLRIEVTTLPDTRPIAWNDATVETVQSQFVAYGAGRILEVAVDFFAQDDDGAVWYFGEDVFNYEDGLIANTDGAWLAGQDGPPGMIMPATPAVGDVYRPENIPGVVFEEVTVFETGLTVDGPTGPIDGAIRIQELLMDGSGETKWFAPGYGEFRAETEDETVNVAIANPIDRLGETIPPELESQTAIVQDGIDAAAAGDKTLAGASFTTAGEALSQVLALGLPALMAEALNAAAESVDAAVAENDIDAAWQAALDLDLALADARLGYAEVSSVDLSRFAHWTRQVEHDASRDEIGDVTGDVATLDAILARLAITPSQADAIATGLDALRTAVESGDMTAIAGTATDLRATLRER